MWFSGHSVPPEEQPDRSSTVFIPLSYKGPQDHVLNQQPQMEVP